MVSSSDPNQGAAQANGGDVEEMQICADSQSVDSVHRHVLLDLENRGTDFIESFKQAVDLHADHEQLYGFGDGEKLDGRLVLYSVENGTMLIHRIIQSVVAGELNQEAATSFVEWLVQGDPMMIADPEPEDDRNALDLAVPHESCQRIIEAICEIGMVQTREKPTKGGTNLTSRAQQSKNSGERISDQPTTAPSLALPMPKDQTRKQRVIEKDDHTITIKVEWKQLIKANRDTCLHLAIKKRRNHCAMYLLGRMHMTGEQGSMLGHRNQSGLTPLHLAVDFNTCSNERVDLVKQMIDIYPRALSIPSGTSSSDTQTAEEHGGGRTAYPSKSTKEGLSPYKHFLESMEPKNNRHATNSQSRARRFVSSNIQQKASSNSESTSRAAEKIKELLRLGCMRYHGRDRALITKLLDTQGQIHLDLNPRTEVTQQLLSYMEAMAFEPYLQYVYIPNLRVLNVNDKELEAEEWWNSLSRKDYVYIFRWLKKSRKVQRILSIIVEDDPTNFHSDEVIEEAVKGFDIEVWNWMKLDMCSDTILAAAKNVRDLTLYWSGNRAILKSWAAPDGLARLEKLEILRIMTTESIESKARTTKVMNMFYSDFEKAWETRWKRGTKDYRDLPKHEISATAPSHIAKRLSEREREEKGRKEKWVRCTEDFAQTLDKYLNNRMADKKRPLTEDQVIKVAIIDDGVDADRDNIGKNIEAGETFYDNKGHWPGYYQSSYGHGHLMARLVQQLCPKVRLYIAKLNELWSDGKPQITTESAAKAIDWARRKEVDIISMSWTIEKPNDQAEALLKHAITEALGSDILLFCASNDQGKLSGVPYPASIDNRIFRIGSATALGTPDEATQKNVMFIAPGSDEVRKTSLDEDLGFAKPRSGSSIATARCAGLAALILQCVMLQASHPGKREMRKHTNMERMFKRMVDDKDGDSKYLRVWKVFEDAKTRAELDKDEEWNIINAVAQEFSRTVPWMHTGVSPHSLAIRSRPGIPD